MDERIQDDGLVKADLRTHERLVSERSGWESTWRAIDERFPDAAGGFNRASPGMVRGAANFDPTHITALDRFKAAMRSITTPRGSEYIVPRFSPELMKSRRVQLWCSTAGPRLRAIRHAWSTGFGTSVDEDWDQLGRYGTSPVWSEARPGRGMFYRTLHLSGSYIDVDFSGLVDTHHGKSTKTARQLEQLFGLEALTPRMRRALEPGGNENTEFEIVHVVAPNAVWDEDKLDFRRFPIGSRYLAIDEKQYLRRGGFNTMPVSVSRHTTSPMEKYGRSIAIKMLPTIEGVNAMRHTTLRAGHKAVDPALVFNNDDGITSLATKPGGTNAGLVSDTGQVLIARVPGGENGIPYAMEMIEQERATIRTAFLEEFYKILTDPNSRMTTTEVLEVMSKQGILVAPYGERYETEKQLPMTTRDLELALAAGQVEPFPPEVLEAGEWPWIDYENELAAMARAQGTAKTLRFMEAMAPIAAVDATVYDYLDTDELIPGMAAEIGVKPAYVRDAKQVMAIRQARAESEQAAVGIEQLATGAGAALDLAKANQIGVAA